MPEQQLIDYKGPLSFGIINQLLRLLKEQMDSLGVKRATYKRVLLITVEILENINKYAVSSKEISEMYPNFPVGFKLIRTEKTYLLIAGNVVKKEKQQIIREKIDRINKLDMHGLKRLYHEIISNGKFTEEGGAGLGFIEIAKTSQQKIGYKFEEMNDAFSYYTIKLELNVD